MKELGPAALNYVTLILHVHLSARIISAVQYNGPEYRSSYWKFGNASGTVYGLDYYMGTRFYRNNPQEEPEVCFNAYDLKEGKYGYFICPPPNKHISYTSCCGERNKQDCCRPPATASSYAFIVGFIGGLVVVCGGGGYFCIKFGESCCSAICNCCSSMVECVSSLYNSCVESISSIGNCCSRKKNDNEVSSVTNVNEMENMHTTETNINKPSMEYGNQHEIQPLKTEEQSYA